MTLDTSFAGIDWDKFSGRGRAGEPRGRRAGGGHARSSPSRTLPFNFPRLGFSVLGGDKSTTLEATEEVTGGMYEHASAPMFGATAIATLAATPGRPAGGSHAA